MIRQRNLFDPASPEPYKLSRSKLEQFIRCPRCFYLDRRLGIGQPSIPGYTLNMAVDTLFKREFDAYRRAGEIPPILKQFRVNAVPFHHPLLDEWRDNTRGVRFLHDETRFLLFGAIDDVWVNPSGELHVVDYKSTSIDGEVSLDGEWKQGYKRQIEIYQWLLRKNGFRVSDDAYFVYANADRSKPSFENKLEFRTTIIRHRGDSLWVEDALREARMCLERTCLPMSNADCEWCEYRQAARGVES